jgi:hypothetical protein
MKNAYRILVEKSERKGSFGDQEVNGRMMMMMMMMMMMLMVRMMMMTTTISFFCQE